MDGAADRPVSRRDTRSRPRSNIQAIETTGYVIAEPVVLDDKAAYDRIDAVCDRFPDRGGMKKEIIAHLRKIGRIAVC